MRLVLLAVIVAACLSLSGQESAEDGPECAPIATTPAVHECHCSGMVDRIRTDYLESCELKPTKAERENCVKAVPETCHMMDYPDSYTNDVQDEERCSNACHKERCACNEKACYRPSVQPKDKKGRK